MRGRRFMGSSLRTLAGMVAAGRLAARRDGRRPDPAADDHLGAIRGEPRHIRGPGASNLYTEWFPGDGGPGSIIFTHGLCLTEAVWHYQKRDLAGGPYSVVTWDLPGHGHSPPVAPGRLTRGMAVDALAKVVDEYADGGGVILAGHSLGGILTLDYLAKNPETAAKAVRGIVLVSTPMLYFARALAGKWPGAPLEARALGKVFGAVVESHLLDRFLIRDVGKPGTSKLSYRVIRVGFGQEPSPSQVTFIRDVIASVPPEVRADAFRTMSGYDIRPFLEDLHTPALVVIGARDRLVNPDESRTLAARLSNADSLILDDVGHASFLEAPKRFNEALAAFAERHLAADRAPETDSA